VNPKLPANPPFYAGFTRNGAPFTSTDRYESTNYTLGFKYQPVDSVTIRASRATAFLPPTPLQLTVNPTPSAFPTDVMDPRSGQTVSVLTQGGGDPSLKPQNSVSENVGVIWEPRGRLLKGLRFNLEYFRTQQFDYITSPSAQLIVNQESTFGGRVTRDAQGPITLVDTSYINLFRLENEGWDVSASYQRQTPLGLFGFLTSHSINEHIMTQYDADEPMYDAVGYPSELGAAKYKSNATVTIASGAVSAGWTARYYSSYQQNGSPGGPMHARHLATGSFWDTSWFTAQGGTRIPSQTYHDAFVGYDFNSRASDDAVGWKRHADSLLSGLSVQVGVRNVFNRVPPMDAYFAGNNYFSPYGDIRLRSYWVTVKKAF
jgi:iron complex outermembrane recepter protein